MDEQRERDVQKEEDTIDLTVLLRDFIRGIGKFWWLLVVLALLGGTIEYFRASGTYYPMYRSQATFTVTTNTSQSSGSSDSDYNFYYDSARADQLALTFPYILSSDLLTDAMEEDMGVEYINGSVSATVIPDSNMITMYAISSDPESAKAILESAIRVYPDVSRFVIGETRFNIIDAPNLPDEPYNQPSYRRQTLMGAGIGLAIGIVFVVVYALLRKTVHKPEQLRKVMNLTCLASIPKVRRKARKKKQNEFISIRDTSIGPWFEESINTLQLRVCRDLDEKGGKTLMVTSTVPGEGKSMISVNLAYALAKNGKQVLLVDADLRRQDLAQRMGWKGSRLSMEEILSGHCEMEKAVTYEPESGIYFLGGKKPLHKTTLLQSKNLGKLLDQIKPLMDYIILDAPPCGAFEDVLLMEDYTDGILYVVMQDHAPRNQIIDAVGNLSLEEAPVIGYVFNGVSNVFGSYGYGYGKYGRYGRYGRYGHYGYHRYGYGGREEKSDGEKQKVDVT